METYYYPNTSAVIMVIDSNDRERIGNLNASATEIAHGGYFSDNNAAEELKAFLDDEHLKDVPLLIFANKKDLPNAMDINTITHNLGLKTDNMYKNRKWHIQSTNATTGEGLYEGLDWLSKTLKNKKK